METRVKIISRDIVKPSSETPQHLKNLKLSYLDQLVPPVYFPILFFYQANESRGLTTSTHLQISEHHKHSLSHTLPSFYPLAGRIKDNSFIDCNDEGVEFIVARVHHAQIMDAVQDPTMEELKQYLPMDPTNNSGEETLLFMQITFFDCGGVAIGLCFSHQIADFTSIMAFINAWKGKNRGEDDQVPRFSFDLSNYFPAREFHRSRFSGFPVSNEEFTTKRFVFDKEKLLLLKKIATFSPRSIVKDPTRVEFISAFIWEIFLKAAKVNKEEKILAAFHVVNLRPRKKPSHLLQNVFGNCTMLAFAVSDEYEGVEEFHDLVSKLRSSIRKINDDYITRAETGDNYSKDHYELFSKLSKGEVERCSFSSWCRFPVYEVDYGWGKPVWLCTTALPAKNLTVLVNSRGGEGIEAWVNMNRENLEMLENQIKLLISSDVKDVKC